MPYMCEKRVGKQPIPTSKGCWKLFSRTSGQHLLTNFFLTVTFTSELFCVLIFVFSSWCTHSNKKGLLTQNKPTIWWNWTFQSTNCKIWSKFIQQCNLKKIFFSITQILLQKNKSEIRPIFMGKLAILVGLKKTGIHVYTISQLGKFKVGLRYFYK